MIQMTLNKKQPVNACKYNGTEEIVFAQLRTYRKKERNKILGAKKPLKK
jgi:hypothetical protein